MPVDSVSYEDHFMKVNNQDCRKWSNAKDLFVIFVWTKNYQNSVRRCIRVRAKEKVKDKRCGLGELSPNFSNVCK